MDRQIFNSFEEEPTDMKLRIVALLLAMALLCAVMPAAMADVEVMVLPEDARGFDLHKSAKTISYYKRGSNYYCLMDEFGNEIVSESAGYTSMNSRDNYYKVEVESADGVHDTGLIDAKTGRVIVPPKYADVEIISDRWQSGITLTPSNADDKDYTFTNYSTNEKLFFRVDTVDYYFDGEYAGTLARSDCYGGYDRAFGAYLMVTNTSKVKTFYNKNMQPSPVQSDYSNEYNTARVTNGTVYTHVGSGQTAFVPECTLSMDEVEDPYLLVDTTVYDLQGNVAFTVARPYTTVRAFVNGYAQVRYDGKYGVIDDEGHEVIPPIYDELGYSYEKPIVYGYASAVRDGKFGFVDAQGNETCDFVYASNIVRDRATFAEIKNLDGTIIVLSAAVGELPEHFVEVDFPTSSGCRAFVATNANKEKAIIDIYGNYLLPYTNQYRSIYLSYDGTVALVYADGIYSILRFEIAEPAQVVGKVDTAPANDGSWTCVNGHSGNTGNFCSECGSPRPEEPAKPAFCPNCGTKLGDNPGNFCPNCGTKLI